MCPSCSEKANAKVDYKEKKARLLCLNCGLNKEKANDNWQMAAHGYFEVELWFVASFKNNLFWAYNYEHLIYLESYISASLREHKDVHILRY